VNPFPQIHEPSESPSYFVYISQHEPPHSTPKLAGRSSPTSVSLSRTRTASRSSNENAPDGNTIPEATKTQDGDSQFSYSRHVCIHCLYCLSNGIFEPSHRAAICGVASKKCYLSQLGVVLRTPETPVNRTGCMEFQKPAFHVAMWMASICTIS
jgi:hypothetical protein